MTKRPRGASELELAIWFATEYGLQFVTDTELHDQVGDRALIASDFARSHNVVPLTSSGSSVRVAMSDPSNIVAIGELRRRHGLALDIVVATRAAVLEAIDAIYSPRGPS